jgi:DNA-directed RNA polymerase specialized sigma24 family protein
MDEEQFATIVLKLDMIIKLQAVSAAQGKSLREQVAMLSSLNLSPKQIADILGKTPNHISVILYEIRRKADSELGNASSNPGEESSKHE